MKIETRLSNRYCLAERAARFSIPQIKQEIERRDGISTGFTTCDTPLPGINQTVFKVYDNGTDLLLAVCALNTFSCSSRSPNKCADSIEVLFDSYHDHLGFFRFVFQPDGTVLTMHHLPYPENQSTAFQPIRVKKHCWEKQTDPGPRMDDARWLFAWFSTHEVFRKGDICGFNVARTWDALRETTAWNPPSGHGTQDASGFGHLYRAGLWLSLEDVSVRWTEPILVMEGRAAPTAAGLGLELVNPYGVAVPVSLTTDGEAWKANAIMRRRIPGRYRLYPRLARGGNADPDYIAFDLSFPRAKRSFTLGMAYDARHDLNMAPYTPDILKDEMRLYADCGVRRIYWIDYSPGMLAERIGSPRREHVKKSRPACGDLLPLAARFAKQQGMAFIGVYKPFDLADNCCLVKPSDARRTKSKALEWEQKYAQAPERISCHQERTMQIHPDWRRTCAFPVTRLRVYSLWPIPALKTSDIRLWCSGDNSGYKRYQGRMTLCQGVEQRPHLRNTPAGNIREAGTARTWYVEMSDLKLNAPFAAVEIVKEKVRICHRAHAFLDAWDAGAKEAPVTLATRGDLADGFSFWKERQVWCNRSPGLVEEYAWETGVHGLTFQQFGNLPSMLEPAFDENRSFWLEGVNRILNTEADGVDIRTLCHHNGVMDYMMYAFAGPVRKAFKTRYGREVTPLIEDCERVRRIRGEFYTKFLRDAKRLATEKGKKLIAHFECGIEVPPQYDLRMQFMLDWETWLKEGIIDEITLKWWFMQNPFIHEKVLPLARKLGVPIHVCDRDSSLLTSRAVERTDGLIRDAYDAGFSGYFFYESADYKFRTPGNVPALQGQAEGALRKAAQVIERITGAAG